MSALAIGLGGLFAVLALEGGLRALLEANIAEPAASIARMRLLLVVTSAASALTLGGVFGLLGWRLGLRGRPPDPAALDPAAARSLERLRRDFVANVSHELRTPVAVIRANAETLLDGALDDPPAAERFLAAIDRQAHSLSRLIDDLLDIARVEAEGFEVEMRSLDVRDLVRRCVDGLGERARKADIAVLCCIDEPIRAMADEGALDQILLNLVENAVRYNQAGGRVEVHARRRNGTVRIEVQDDGVGVVKEDQARLFERFYRVDGGRSRETGGTGLGLAIVKHLVDAMDGHVGVESELGQGSTFFVELAAG